MAGCVYVCVCMYIHQYRIVLMVAPYGRAYSVTRAQGAITKAPAPAPGAPATQLLSLELRSWVSGLGKKTMRGACVF